MRAWFCLGGVKCEVGGGVGWGEVGWGAVGCGLGGLGMTKS